jgi:hypothetical protein
MFREARSLGAIVSINHPEAPTGEICMGCGWTPSKAVDFSLVNALEVVNGGGHPATRFWEQQLREGHRPTAIGGSDNHHANWPPEKSGSIGYPTTVIYAQNLSVAAILDGLRSGRAFIDVTGSRNRLHRAARRRLDDVEGLPLRGIRALSTQYQLLAHRRLPSVPAMIGLVLQRREGRCGSTARWR